MLYRWNRRAGVAMITLFGTGAVIATVSGIGAIHEYWTDPDKVAKRRLHTAIRRARLAINKLETNLPNKIDFPKLKWFKKTEYGYYAGYDLPVGVTMYDCFSKSDIIEGAMNGELEMWTEGQTWHLKIYNQPIPEKIPYQEVEGDKILIGYSRKGIEYLDFKEAVSPHILIGGASGMGKSNATNVILTQLLRLNAELYLIDPKRVELNIYEKVTKVKAIAKDISTGAGLACHVADIMEKREQALDKAGFQNIHAYNAVAGNALPYVFLVVDEFADFEGVQMFWDCVGAIARKGRALGVYLILVTQRPSADVLKPQVKANMGIKIAFRVTTLGNSKILLENEKAYLLPYKTGRCILDTGLQHQMQMPYLSRDVHSKLLEKYKGDENNVLDERSINGLRSGWSSGRSKRGGKTSGDYGAK